MNELSNEDRVLLAEFVGARYEQKPHYGCAQDGEGLLGYTTVWTMPDGRGYEGLYYHSKDKIESPPFNPETSHADCHALIEALVPEHLDWLEITFGSWKDGDGPAYALRTPSPNDTVIERGTDYREGVVTLALSIAREAKYAAQE